MQIHQHIKTLNCFPTEFYGYNFRKKKRKNVPNLVANNVIAYITWSLYSVYYDFMRPIFILYAPRDTSRTSFTFKGFPKYSIFSLKSA